MALNLEYRVEYRLKAAAAAAALALLRVGIGLWTLVKLLIVFGVLYGIAGALRPISRDFPVIGFSVEALFSDIGMTILFIRDNWISTALGSVLVLAFVNHWKVRKAREESYEALLGVTALLRYFEIEPETDNSARLDRHRWLAGIRNTPSETLLLKLLKSQHPEDARSGRAVRDGLAATFRSDQKLAAALHPAE